MDTRLKSFKRSLIVKLLCWILAGVLFCLTFMTGTKIIASILFFGIDNFINKDDVTFYETDAFETMFYSDVFRAFDLSSESESEFFDAVNRQKEIAVDDIKNDYLNEKADIIRNELIYAVENWDASYYNYDKTVTDINLSEKTVDTSLEVRETTEAVTVIEPDGTYDIPESIRLAQQILATKSGLEFLEYESLVRADAFNYSYNATVELLVPIYGSETSISLTLTLPMNVSEGDISEYISQQYDDAAVLYYINHTYYYSIEDDFSNIKSMKYYIVKADGTVVSNVSEIPSDVETSPAYFMYKNGEYKTKGIDRWDVYGLHHDNKGYFCLYFDGNFDPADGYGKNYITYETLGNVNSIVLLVAFLVLLILFILVISVWLSMVGYNKNSDKPVLFLFDRIPNDIHFFVSFGLIVSYVLLCVYIIVGYLDLNSFAITDRSFCLLGLALFVVFALLSEWLASVSRCVKTKNSYFKKTLIYFIVRKIGLVLRKIINVFKYKPAYFKIQAIFAFIGVFLVNLIFGVLTVVSYDVTFLFFAIPCAVFDVFVGYCLSRYVKNLDMIIQKTEIGERIVFEQADKTAASLIKLAENLNNQNTVLESAIAEAVKKEQMKTQLITNVSHDLKTPLTSLINYSDLLKKCEIEDEQAKRYIETINIQSEKMKRLIEDLIEASKVSTGNVTINKVRLNLCELAVQAIVEFSPEIEKNRNEIKFTEPVSVPYVYADSIKTYRVLANLFSNVRKYAAPNTRVYADVYSDDKFGVFEIKNISKEELNISPDMLTERFVRGDESRTNEGNGLGLSIASDLCKLMGGSLEIIVDGDLFKAIVRLPLAL